MGEKLLFMQYVGLLNFGDLVRPNSRINPVHK